MLISLEDQSLAFFGSFAYVLWLVLIYLKHRNTGKTKIKETIYFKRNWLGFLIYILIAQILCAAKEYLAEFYISYMDQPKYWDFYVNTEQGISFLIGVFGVGLFEKVFKLGNNYLK